MRETLCGLSLWVVAVGLSFMIFVGCDSPGSVSSDLGEWKLIGQTPDIIGPWNGIYKLHSDKEKATFYASRVHGGWSISVVKD